MPPSVIPSPFKRDVDVGSVLDDARVWPDTDERDVDDLDENERFDVGGDCGRGTCASASAPWCGGGRGGA